MTKLVSFDVSHKDASLIAKIVKRAATLEPSVNKDKSLEMDLTACHANGCPLDLEKFLAARPADFAHDINGISRHINRRTGGLEDHFLPRCALPE